MEARIFTVDSNRITSFHAKAPLTYPPGIVLSTRQGWGACRFGTQVILGLPLTGLEVCRISNLRLTADPRAITLGDWVLAMTPAGGLQVT